MVPAWSGSRNIGDVEYREVGYRGPRDGADIVIVGDNPTGYDIYARRPLTGEIGVMVDAELRGCGLNPEHVFFANACRCLLHKEDKAHKKILREAMSSCRPALERALRHLKPKLIVCFGEVATFQVLRQGGVSKLRGRLQRSDEFDCWVLPTFHPAICYRDQGKLAFWGPDMAFIGEFARAGFEQAVDVSNPVYRDVSSIDFILAKKNITVALDTETQGKDWTDINSVVISYSVTDKEGTGYNVWLCRECAEEDAVAMIQWPRKVGKVFQLTDVFIQFAVDYEKKIAELRELCSRPDIKIVMQNGNYDLHRLRQLGISRDEVNSYVMDTQLAAHTLDSTNFVKASLSDIQAAYMNSRVDHKISFKQSADISDMLAASLEDPERHTQYSCADTDVTLSCAKAIKSRLLNDKQLANYYVHLAHPVQSLILYEIEKNGIPFDIEKLPETKNRVADILREKERNFLELVPARIRRLHENAGLKLSRPRFIRDVFFHEDGFRLPVGWVTNTGEASTNRTILRRLRDTLPDNKAKDALSLLIEWGPYQKLYTTYLKGFEAAVKSDGRLHTQITKAGTETGRSCIAKGTRILCNRGYKESKHGIPIEEIRPGDMVYCFDDNLQPRLKRVIWAGKTGTKNVVRIYYKSSGSKQRGFIDMTPEHKIRMSDGRYVEAQNVMTHVNRRKNCCTPKRSCLSITRPLAGIAKDMRSEKDRLYVSGYPDIREHVFVWEQINGAIPPGMVVHHIDGDHANHAIENLEMMSNELHTGHHANKRYEDDPTSKKRAIQVLLNAASKPLRGEEHPSFMNLTKLQCLRALAKAKGRPTKVPWDFETFKKYCSLNNIDLKAVALRYSDYGYISRGVLLFSLYTIGSLKTQSKLKIGHAKLRRLCRLYRIKEPGRRWQHNHIITGVGKLSTLVDVYDIEVEDCHNFIANGICVHNSSANPNLQNVPKRNKDIMRAIRLMLYAPEGKMLVAVDYSQSELRWIAHESMDTAMVKIFKDGDDMHVITAKDMAAKKGLRWEDMDEASRKSFRQQAKPVNFGFPYGQSAVGFQAYALDNYGAKFTLAEAELYRKTFFDESYPGLRTWHQRRISEAKRFGFVRSAFGFIRHTPNISSSDQFLRGADARIAVNTGIQSASNDATLLGALEARRSGLVDDVRAQIVLFIHDELIYMVDEDYVDYFVPRIIEYLENIPTERFGFKMRVPLVAEATVGKNLAEMNAYSQEGK
jgi:uracil-DNA glycosylase family 4